LPSKRAVEGGTWDVIIVGAGPAGLSAALILGRCCRRVLICDRGTPRSWASKAMHGFLSRDPISPDEFRQLGIDDLCRYENVELIQMEVDAIQAAEWGFTVSSKNGESHACRKLLIATGLFDELPKIDGVFAFFGTSVFQCPYCDGWEARGKAVAVYGRALRGYQMARALTAWTKDIVLCTNGPAGLSATQRDALARNRIPIVETPIAELIGKDGMLESIAFENGDVRPCSALFFDTPSKPQSNLAQALG
jgi:thioredoxin reductase